MPWEHLKKSCIQIFSELIKEDCFVEAMNILDYYILIYKELQIHLSELSIVSAQWEPFKEAVAELLSVLEQPSKK